MVVDKKFLATIKERDFILGLLAVIFLVTPGVGVIFVFNPELFANLDWMKLILLSMTVTTPLSVWNAIILSDLLGLPPEDKDSMFLSLGVGIVMTAIVIFWGISLNYFFGRSFHDVALLFGCAEIGLTCFVLIQDYWTRKATIADKK